MQTIIDESFEPLYHKHDYSHIVIKTYPKNDMTFGQFREFAYSTTAWGYANRGEMLQGFVRDRKDMQPRNKLLHDASAKHKLTDLLDQICEWKTYPYAVRGVKLVKARWLCFGGDCTSLVGDDGVQYWYVHFSVF